VAIDGERGGWRKGTKGIDKALWKEKKVGCLNCGTEASIYTLSAALAEAKSVCIVWRVFALFGWCGLHCSWCSGLDVQRSTGPKA
jgi:hypothetical protein